MNITVVNLVNLDLSSSKKNCQVDLEKLDLSKLDLNNNMGDTDSDIVIESLSQDSENYIEVVYSEVQS